MPHGHQHESPQKVCQIAVVCQKVPLDELACIILRRILNLWVPLKGKAIAFPFRVSKSVALCSKKTHLNPT